MSFFRLLGISLAVLTLWGTTGCKSEGCTDPLAVNYDPEAEKSSGECTYPVLSLGIQQMFDGQPLTLNTDYSINGTVVQFQTVNFYLDEFRLMDDEGTLTDQPEATLLVRNGTTAYSLGEITTGHKHMIRFGVGVDSATNFGTDPATLDMDNPLAPQAPNMHWSWDNGYIFLRIDGQVDSDDDGVVDAPIEIHLGKQAFFTEVMVMLHENAHSETYEVALAFDLADLFSGIDLANNSVTHVGDNLALAQQVQANVASAFSHP